MELRQLDPAFHDFALTNPQDTLAEMGTGTPCWTAPYAGAVEQLTASRVAFRPLVGLATQTSLAFPPGPPTPALAPLLDACPTA